MTLKSNFHYLFSLKIRVEIRFNNVLDRKDNFFFNYIKKNFQSLKKRIFLKGLTHAFGQEMEFFYYLFSSSIRVEIRLNNVLQSPKKSLFSKWVKNAKLERENTSLSYKNKKFKNSKN